MCHVAQAARIFYNWIANLADALAIEVNAALRTDNITNKEVQMAPDIARPEDKKLNGNSKHSQDALAERARRNGHDTALSDLDRILALEHTDPHTFLGAHRVGGGTIIRAYRPNADAITLLLDDGLRIRAQLRVSEIAVCRF